MPAIRRLSAILAADVAGYSRLIGADEQRTLERLRAIRTELIDPSIAAHNGRIVKTTGDGLLAEFGSTVDALRCAFGVQEQMAERNAEQPADGRIEFRMGVHQGDIVVEDGDIFGDGVNIAARLESLSEPGGICVSARVQEDAVGKLDIPFRDLGEQHLKNIARPVRAYAVGGLALPPATPSRRTWMIPALFAAAAVAVIAMGVAAWWTWPQQNPPGPTEKAAAAAQLRGIPAESKTAPRLSIVALPFANLTNDPDQQYLADGITEDVTTDLSRLPGMQVISRNSAFTYKNRQINTRQIGGELNVRYVLEGSVQRAGKRVRVNAQLIDAATDNHLWAERFDRDADELFELLNDITSRIALALNLEIVNAEARRPIGNPDVLDYLLRARAIRNSGPPTRERFAEAIALFERAVALDPDSVEAQSALGHAFASRVLDAGMSVAPKPDIARAETLLAATLAAQPQNPSVRYLRAQITRAYAQGDFGLSVAERVTRFAAAIPDYEFVLAANPNDTAVMSHLAWCKFMTGASQEAMPLLEKSIRLNPRDPYLYLRQWRLATVYLFHGRIAEAIELLEQARAANPSFLPVRSILAAAYGLKGDPRAAAEVAELQKIFRQIGETRFSTIALIREHSDWNSPQLHEGFEKYFIAGLREAGVPEQ